METSKTCKKCQATIPSKAVVCMHCGNKQGGITFFKVFVWGFVILFVYSWVSISNEDPAPSSEKNKSSQIDTQAESKKLFAEKNAAGALCMDAVRKAARFPSSVDFSAWDSIGTTPMIGGGWKSQWAFEAKNGVGLLVSQKVYCEIKDGKLQQFIVSNR